ncbi:hypothetical protein Pcinc_036548 [Petrolisthes cinctipes]|uniref:Uncharacterized protein n=1 Tax=Petrolisthes cinctipes TaxID=88211 RepID=A0AAE1EM93_PETCI|nr:hypothetical protein Pcinc_036548 [Petrolisthes cinctipes]
MSPMIMRADKFTQVGIGSDKLGKMVRARVKSVITLPSATIITLPPASHCYLPSHSHYPYTTTTLTLTLPSYYHYPRTVTTLTLSLPSH